MNLDKTLRITFLSAFLCCAANAWAANLYWDPTLTGGSTGSGSGTWNTNSTANWWSGTADIDWTDVTGTNTAVFGGAAGTYTVTVAGNDTVNALTFNTTGYTLSGGTVTLAGTTPTISGSGSATINSILAGSAGLMKTGTGTLTLGGAAIYAGATVIGNSTTAPGGTIALGVNNALPAGNALTIDNRDGTSSLNLATFNQTIGALTLYGGNSIRTAITSSGGTLALSGNVTLVDSHTSGQDYSLIINAPIDLNGATRTLTVGYGANNDSSDLGDLQLKGSIFTSSGTAGLTIAPQSSTYPGTVTLEAANTYNGPTTLQGTSTLALNANNAIPNNSAFVQSTGSTLDLTAFGKTTGISTGMGSLTGAGTIKLGSAGVLTIGYDNTSPAAYTGVISGAGGAIIKTGAGMLTLTGFNSYTGPTTISGGTLQIGNGGSGEGLASSSISDGSTLIFNHADALTYAGAISAGGNLVKLGNGILSLTGTNTYSGGTTIAGGALVFTSSSALPATPATNSITIAGGGLAATGPYSTVNGWFNSGLITPNPTSGAIAVSGSDAENINLATGIGANYANLSLGAVGNATYSGTLTPSGTSYALGGGGGTLNYTSAISGANSVTISGPGAVLLTNTNNGFSSATTITGALLQAPSIANGGNSSSLGQSSSAAQNLVLNGGTLQYTGGPTSTDRLFTLVAASTLDASGNGPITWGNTGAIAFSGTGSYTLTLAGSNTGANVFTPLLGDNGSSPSSLAKVGPGDWTLASLNTYSGPTTISGGTLAVSTLANGGQLSSLGQSSSASANLVFNGGTLEYTGPSVSINRGFTKTGTATLRIDQPGAGLTLGGIIAGGGNLNLTGPGATLNLTAANALTGATTLGSGTLNLFGSQNTYLNSAITVSAGALVQSYGQLNLDVNQNGSSSSINVAGAGMLRLSATAASASAPDVYFGPDHSGTSYYGAAIEVTTLDLGSAQRYFTANSGHDSFAKYNTEVDAYDSSNMIGSGGITYTGYSYNTPATSDLYAELVLAGSNTFSGPVQINQGAIFLSGSNALTQANALTLSASATGWSHFFLFGNNATISNLQSTGPAPGNTAVANGTLTMSQSGVTTPVTLTVNETANTTFAGTIADKITDTYDSGSYVPGSLSLVKSGTATLTLSGTSNYSGTTTVGAGILNVTILANGGVLSPIGTSSNSATNLILKGGTLQYTGTGGSTDRLFTLDAAGGAIDASGTGPINWTNPGAIAFSGTGAHTLTLTGVNTGPNTLTPLIADSGSPTSVLKTGPGTWVLSPSNTYTGATTVQQGLLQFSPSSNLYGPILVNGGTLALNNSLTAPTTTVQQGVLQLNGGSNLQSPLLVNGGNVVVSNSAAVTSMVVQQGLLQLNGGSSLQSPLMLSGGSLLVNNPYAAGATQTAAISTGFIVSSPSALNFQVGATWNPAIPLLSSGGSLEVDATATVNVASFAPLSIGDYPLISASGGIGGASGTAGLVLGALPPRVLATLDTTTQPGTVLLDVTSFDTIKWSGAQSSEWDTTTPNWQTVLSHQTTTYIAQPVGDTVTFDDSATRGTVDLPTVVQPSQITVNNNTLNYTFATSTGTGGIGGTTQLTKSGSGSLTLATNNTYSGGTTIDGGTLTLGDGVTPGVGAITGNVLLNSASGSPVLQFNRPDTALFAGSVSGTGSFVQAGPGTLIVTGSNTYAGLTLISGGSLQIGNGGSSGSMPGDITNNAAVIYSRSDTVTLVNTISGSGTTVVNSGVLQVGNGGPAGWINGPSVTNALLAFNLAGNPTYSGVISGSGGVELSGNSLTLAGSSSYTGATSINSSVLSIGNIAGVGSPSSPANLVFNGGTLVYTGSSGVAAHGVTLNGSGATFDIPAGQTLSLSGSVNGGGGLTNNGPGALMLMGQGAISGPVTANAGILSLASTINLYRTSPMTINAGAVVQSFGQLNLDVNQNGSLGSSNITGAGTLQLMATGASQAVPDIYFGPDHSGNDYWGAAMNVATLDLGSAQRYIDAKTGHNSVAEYYTSTYTDARISSNIIGSGGITFYATSSYDGQYAELLLSGSNTFSGRVEVDRGAIFLNNPNALTQSNAVTLSNSDSSYSNFFLLGNNTTISNLQSAGTTPGNTGVANGNPYMSGPTQAANPATLTINETANTIFAGTIANTLNDGYTPSSGVVPGPLSLVKTGSATLTLTGSSAYSGTTTVSGGVLSVSWLANGLAPSPIGSSPNGPANLNLAGGTLQYTGAGGSTDRLFTLDVAGGAIDASGSGPLAWTNPNPIAFSGTGVAGVPRVLTLCGSNTGPNTLGVALTDNTDTTTAVFKTGPGTWILSGSNTYSGPTTVQQGLLQFSPGSTLYGPLMVSGGSAIADTLTGTTATVQQGLLQFINGASSLSGSLTVSGGSAVVSTTVAAASTTVQQGMLQINGGSSLQSPLLLSGGTLLANNPYAAGATQTAMIGSGLTVSSPSTLNLQAGTTWSTLTPLLSGSGSLTMNSTATINLASYGALSVGDFPLIEMSGGTLNGTKGLSGLVLGILPPRVTAKLAATNLGGLEIIDLDITSADTIKWSGALSNEWDTTTKNWLSVSYGTATTYIAQPTGDAVTFDDTAKSGTVDIAAVVQPSQITVNNNALNYTFTTSTGTGGVGGAAFLTKSGSANLTLATNNTYSGGTFINGGTVTIGDGVDTVGSLAGNVALSNTATGTAVLQFNRPGTTSLAGNISGSGSLVQAGPGALIVTGSNTFVGSTLVNGGTLQIGNGGASGSIPSDPVNNTIFNNGTIVFDTNNTVVLVNNATTGLAISGSGTTYVNGGTLQLGDGSTSSGTLGGPIVTNATLAFNAPSALTYSGVISGSGGVAQAGVNPLTLTASNSYSGPTAVNGSLLTIGDVANVGSPSSSASLSFNGGTLEYSGTTANGTATAAHGLSLGTSGATFQIDNAGQTLTLTGPVSGAGGLTNAGPGALMLTGTGTINGPVIANANTQVPSISTPLPGSTTPLGSLINIGSGATLGVTGQLRLNAGSLDFDFVTGGGTLALLNPNSSITNPDIYCNTPSNAYWAVTIDTPINLGSGARYIGGSSGNNSYGEYGTGDLGLAGPLYGTASLTVNGTPYNSQFEVALLADNSGWTGPLTIVQGDVATPVANALNGNNVTFAPSGGTATTALYLFGQDISIGSLSGTGSGNMYIRNGSLTSGGFSTQPRSNAVLTVNQAVNGTFAGIISDGPNDYYGGSSPNFNLGLVMAGSATLTLTGTNTYTGATTVSAGVLSVPLLANGGTASSIGASTNNAGNLNLAGGTLQYTGGGASTDRLFTLDVAGGAIDASGSGPLNWTNPGTIGFSGAGVAGVPRTLTLCGTNTGLNTLGVTLADNTDTTTAVTKTGPGTWVLSPSNTYTGATTVQQGLLLFSGSGGLQGPLMVSGGTLLANNSIAVAGPTTVQQGLLQLNGGSSLQGPVVLGGGTLTVNNPYSAGATQSTTIGAGFTVSSPSTMNLAAGSSWDPSVPFFSGSGSLTVNSTATINLATSGPLSAGSYPLMALSGGTFGGASGLSGLVLGSLPARLQATLAQVNQGGVETLELNVSSYDTIKWSGAQTGEWDTSTPNWLTVNSATATAYMAQTALTSADGVTFDDSATRGTVDLPAVVQPNWVTINNNTLNYTLSSSTGTGGIGGPTYLDKSGSGNFTLATNNTYSGGTTISGGTLTLGDGVTAGVGSIAGNVLLNSATGSPVLQFNRPDTAIFAGNISGSGSLVQTGPGTLIVTGSNSYGGSTLINGGTLQIGNGTASGSIPSDPVNNTIVNNAALVYDRSDTVVLISTISGSGTTYVNGGTLQLGDGTTMGSINGAIVTNATLAFNAPYSLTYSGAISGSGGVAQVGINPLTLSGSSTYTGPTSIGPGGLIIGDVSNVGSPGSTANLIFNGGTLEYTGTTNESAAHGLSVGAGGATVQIDDPALTLAFTGPTSGAGGLTLPGPGSLALAGSFSLGGPTQVNGGTLALLGNVNTHLNSPINIGYGSVVQSAATLNLDVNQNGSTSSVNVTGLGTLQLVSTGRSVSSPDIYFGPDHSGTAYYGAAIGAATLDLGSVQRYFTANSGHNGFAKYDTEVDAYVSSNIIGSGGITYTGYSYNAAATSDLYAELVLAGSNSFSGPVQINQGAIFLDNAGALTQANALTLSASATGWSHFFLFGNNATISNLQSAGPAPGNTAVANGTLTMTEPGVSSPVTLTINETANTTFAGTIADAVTDHYDSGSSVPGPLTLAIAATSTGTLTLTGSNGYSGGTIISGGGLQLGNSAALGSGGLTANGGTLDLHGFSVTVNSFSGAAGLVTNNGAADSVLTVSQSTASSFNGTISDGPTNRVALSLTGSGMLTLGGSNNYSGGTSLTAGTLQAGGPSSFGAANGALTVNAGLVDLNGTNQSVGAFSGGGGTIANNGGGTSIFFIGNGNAPGGIYGGLIADNSLGSGTLALVKNGSGTVTLNGVNAFSGGTTINGGVLVMGNNSALGNPTGAGSVSLAINGGTLDLNGTQPIFAALSGNGVIGNSSTGGFAIFNYDNSTTSSTFGGTIRDTLGAGNQTVGLYVGSGTLTLTGSNTFSGGTTVDGSSLLLGPGGSLMSPVKVTDGGTFGMALLASGGTATVGSTLYVGHNSTLDLGSDLVTNTLSATAGTLAGANLDFDLSSSAADKLLFKGAASVSGTNTINITAASPGLVAGNYTLISASSGLGSGFTLATTTLDGDTLSLINSSSAEILKVTAPASSTSFWATAQSGNWSTGPWTGGVPNGVAAGAVFNAPTKTPVTITLDAPCTVGTLVLGNSSSTSTGYNLSGSNTLTLNNSTTATITVANGSHVIDAPVVFDNNLVVSGSGTLAFGASGSITDSGGGLSLTINGAHGTLILSGSDNYSGGTYVDAGTLIAAANGALPSGSSLTVGAGGTLVLDSNEAVAGPVSGAAIVPAAAGVVAVPEPGVVALLLAALCSAAICCRFRRPKAFGVR